MICEYFLRKEIYLIYVDLCIKINIFLKFQVGVTQKPCVIEKKPSVQKVTLRPHIGDKEIILFCRPVLSCTKTHLATIVHYPNSGCDLYTGQCLKRNDRIALRYLPSDTKCRLPNTTTTTQLKPMIEALDLLDN